MSHSRYFAGRDEKNEEKLAHLLAALPPYCKDYFRGIRPATTSMTRVAYAYDLSMFFTFLRNSPDASLRAICEAERPECLSAITKQDVECYLEYLEGNGASPNDGPRNRTQGIRRRFSSLKSFLSYFCEAKAIPVNPTDATRMPKLREKEIIRMDQDEMREFLTELENGTGLRGKEIAYHGRFQVRDKAMLSLMLGTGIRVSECVGLDLEDIDLTKNAAHIQRKGGMEATVYYNDEVKENLRVYLEERTGQQAASGHESALFLSREQCRISVRGVEYLVKKYASVVTPDKRITPHKLRSSYGTALYAKTNDIYLVGSVLGHKNINVTAKFYTDIEEKKKKSVKDLDLLN